MDEAIHRLVSEQKDYFAQRKTLNLDRRKEALRTLKTALIEREGEFLEALRSDLSKPPAEAYLSEIGLVRGEINYIIRHLHSWVRPQRVRTPLLSRPASSRIYPEPYGVVLIVSPWNYPIQLALAPLAAALAAGNCVLLKPSEIAPASSRVLARVLGDIFEPGLVKTVEGGADTARALLEENFDYIFFTGGKRVGKLVMAAASRNLTPVTLELGGKNPCLVDQDIAVETAARRIVWGKFFNAGQTCVAPDYLLVHQDIRDDILAAMKKAIGDFYGTDPRRSTDYGRIINQDHYLRLLRMLDGVKPEIGGECDPEAKYLAPTVVSLESPDHPLMEEEIFGPILPVLTYRHLDQALAITGRYPKPLAFYLFTRNRRVRQRIIRETSSGGICVNDTISQIINPELPFGGVGQSGMGNYHGAAGFRTFSHHKSVMRRSFCCDLKLKYPPYRTPLKTLKKIIRFMF